MSDPTFGPLSVGNVQDDDSTVIDSLVEQAPEPPPPPVEPIATPALPTPRVPTRIISVRQYIDNTWNTPTLLLPDDLDRLSLTIRVTPVADNATDGVAVLSEVRGSVVGLGILTGGTLLTLDHHTGQVRVLGINGPVYVDVWSVTK